MPKGGVHDAMEMEIVPTDVLNIGMGDGAFLVLPREEEEVLVSPRRVEAFRENE